ncbi:MAG: DUF47 family protein [Actinobacteria bacterium]|nr:DUF47 family protein [Actinomycetota bacterium]
MKRRRHWFLPANPDVLALLLAQSGLTTTAMRELAAWAKGEVHDAERLRRLEHEADTCKRNLRRALSEAFTTPLEPEDIFELSVGLDEIVNDAKNLVREAEAMSSPPDEAMVTMAERLAAGTARLDEALRAFAGGDRDAAGAMADRAVKEQRHIQRAYRTAMSALVESGDLREVTARRELYRRLARAGDEVVRVAERIWYSVLKEE